jgi:hypothetical protein
MVKREKYIVKLYSLKTSGNTTKVGFLENVKLNKMLSLITCKAADNSAKLIIATFAKP